jgi:hypothetical protein
MGDGSGARSWCDSARWEGVDIALEGSPAVQVAQPFGFHDIAQISELSPPANISWGQRLKPLCKVRSKVTLGLKCDVCGAGVLVTGADGGNARDWDTYLDTEQETRHACTRERCQQWAQQQRRMRGMRGDPEPEYVAKAFRR